MLWYRRASPSHTTSPSTSYANTIERSHERARRAAMHQGARTESTGNIVVRVRACTVSGRIRPPACPRTEDHGYTRRHIHRLEPRPSIIDIHSSVRSRRLAYVHDIVDEQYQECLGDGNPHQTSTNRTDVTHTDLRTYHIAHCHLSHILQTKACCSHAYMWRAPARADVHDYTLPFRSM